MLILYQRHHTCHTRFEYRRLFGIWSRDTWSRSNGSGPVWRVKTLWRIGSLTEEYWCRLATFLQGSEDCYSTKGLDIIHWLISFSNLIYTIFLAAELADMRGLWHYLCRVVYHRAAIEDLGGWKDLLLYQGSRDVAWWSMSQDGQRWLWWFSTNHF